MFFFAFLLIGGVCLFMLPVDLFPDMDIPAITVVTMYEGASPTDVEQNITKILEDGLATVPDLKHMMSKSIEGMSVITLTFEWGTDLDTRANDVRDSVSQVKFLLPEDAKDPLVYQFDMSTFPIMVFGFSAKENSADLKDTLENVIGDPLKRISGVGAVQVYVSAFRQINVYLDREKLASYALTPQDVVRAINLENQTIPAGSLQVGDTDYLIRVPGEFKSAIPMKDIVLSTIAGRVVRLSDVGEVEDALEEPSMYVKVNSNPGAILIVQKQSSANTVDVAKQVHKQMQTLVKRLPPDVQTSQVLLMDQSDDIMRMVKDLTDTFWQGGLLAVIVVLLFLRRIRATFVIALTIPFSVIITIIAMYFLGYTINMMTLFAMIIGVGMVVDNAIVILENITRHREEGERPQEGAIYGTSEVGLAVIASTLTTVCVFFPILFVKGITKIIFSQFAITISIILVSSLVTALTLTPMLASQLMKKANTGENWFTKFFADVFDKLSDRYTRLLKFALANKGLVIVASTMIFVASVALIPFIGGEFMPEEDTAFLMGNIQMPVGTHVDSTLKVMEKVEKILRQEIEKSVGPGKIIAFDITCGQSKRGVSLIGDSGPHIGSFMCRLVKKEQRSKTAAELSDIIRKRIQDIQHRDNIVKFTISARDPLASILSGSGGGKIILNIYGEDMDETDAVAEQARQIFEKTPGAVDVTVSRVRGRPELTIHVDREKAQAMGLNVYNIADTIRAGFSGKVASKFRTRGEEYDIYVRLRKGDRSKREDLMATPIRLPDGRLIRISDIAEEQVELGPSEIERKDKSRVVNVNANTFQRSLGDVAKDMNTELAKLDLPRGVDLYMAGQIEDQIEAFMWLALALIVALLLVFMVMAGQFESFIDPFVIMFSIPFALTGVVMALVFSHSYINIVTLIGFLMLIGIVVNNAIVLVDYTNILRRRGMEMHDAVVEAGRTRLRPVLMTALTTIVAIIPMAFKSGQSSEVWNPLGLSVLGGMIVSTGITLVLVPVLYSLMRRAKA